MFYNLKQPPYVIGMPTETVYGLAARIDLHEGIEAIFRIKERPFFDPLIVHVATVEQAMALVKSWPHCADILAKKFWPGPLTMVLPKADSVHPMITSGLETVGIRMPRHPVALKLILEEGVPLAAPSANKFGRTSPTTAAHVQREFGDQIAVLDGGACDVGIESTVLLIKESSEGPQLSILRPGMIQKKDIQLALEEGGLFPLWMDSIAKKESPGHMKHHYMPEVPLVLVREKGLNARTLRAKISEKISDLPAEIDGVKMIVPSAELKTIRVLQLSSDATLAAREFYSRLREIAAENPDLIIFYEQDFHQAEAWGALFDRLTKAASLIV